MHRCVGFTGLVFWVACKGEPSVLDSDTAGGDSAAWEVVSTFPECDAPVGWGARFTNSSEARGLQATLQATPGARYFHGMQTGVIAEDVDLDDDIDLIFWDGVETLSLFLNDGAGGGEAGVVPPPPERFGGQYLRGAAVGDIDGDALVDLVWVGDGIILVSRNLGGGTFAEWATLVAESGEFLSGYVSASFGDLDGDGDLDAVVAGLDQRPAGAALPMDPAGWRATPDLILRNDGGQLVVGSQLIQQAGANLSLMQTFTDRDQDGDVDLWSWSDRADVMQAAPGAAFWRNDAGTLINDAAEISANTRASAMGYASYDLNGDGRFDYCVTDIADQLVCLLSDGQGGYYEGGAALGLTVDRSLHPGWQGIPSDVEPRAIYTGWGLVLADLNNDSHVDGAATASIVSQVLSLDQPVVSPFQPHWMWRGLGDGTFQTDLSAGFGQATAWAWGLAQADLDGDGSLELIAAPWQGRPEIWNNPCTQGRALQVSLDAGAANRRGVGATVIVRADGRQWQQEVGSAAAGGQNPSRLHFGLGDRQSVAEVVVRWPGGGRTVIAGVQTNTHIRITR